MTIEAEIKKLTTAVEALTTAITEGLVSKTDFDAEHRMETFGPLNDEVEEKPKAKTKAKKPESEPEPEAEEVEEETEDDEDGTSEITAASVRDLAKEKIKSGSERKDVKKLISDLGADSISDLDPKSLAKLNSQLEAL